MQGHLGLIIMSCVCKAILASEIAFISMDNIKVHIVCTVTVCTVHTHICFATTCIK